MNPCLHLRRLRAVAVATLGLIGGSAVFAGTTTISTATYADDGRGTPRHYTVPSGANCVTIQAWGAQGYVQTSYNVTPGWTFSIVLAGGNGGDTKVATPVGTVHTAGGPGLDTASGVDYNTTLADDWTSGGAPASPGVGNKYDGYVIITAYRSLFSLSISPSPTSGGTTSGAGTYAPNTKVTIKENASLGFIASGWSGPGGGSVASSTSPTTTIVMTADANLVANFTPQTPVFTSGNSTQVLTVGTPYTYQVSATEAPIFSASNLPPGLSISSSGTISGTPTSVGTWTATVTASKDSVAVEETGAGPSQVVTISSSTLGNNQEVYAGSLDLQLNGASSVGFCIDPWHWSVENQTMVYNWEALESGPKLADGMGANTALQIEQLWQQFYSPMISSSTAAGLQIAIWDLVTASISAQTGGVDTFSLDSSNDYGASSMISWVDANPDAATANLEALTGGGQDYVTSTSNLPSNPLASATQSLPFIVYAVPVVQGGTVTIPVSQPYSYSISATENPTTYGAGGTPPGLSVNRSSGVISGTPTTPGTYTVALSATNPGGTGTNTLAVTVVPNYTLSISGSSSSGGTYTGAGSYPAGTVVTITQAANSGYRAAGWTGADAGSVSSPTSATTTITMDSNKSIVADFIQQVTLTVVAGTGGTATGSGTFDVGSVAPIAATPNSPYSFGSWSGSGVSSPSTASATVALSGNETVTASFTPPNCTLTIAGSTPDGGTFTGAGTYVYGTVVTISQSANGGYRAAGWTGADAGSVASPSSTTTTITMTADKSIVADFIQQVTLTVDAGSGGTATGGGTFDIGTTVPISATPSTGYDFSDWTGASPAKAGADSTTITLNANATITAQFAPEPPTAVLNAAATAYTGSPFNVTSTASAPASNLTLHSIEWLSPSGEWTVSSASASGGTSNRSLGITFPATGVYTLRAGASTDNGNTWVYSPNVQVTVSNGIASYTLQTMAVPASASALAWYAPSPVVQKTYEVQHLNP